MSGALERPGAVEAHARLPEDGRLNTSPATLFQLFLPHEYRVATVDRRSFSVHGSEGRHCLRIATAGDEAGFRRFVASGAKLTLWHPHFPAARHNQVPARFREIPVSKPTKEKRWPGTRST